LRERDNKNFWGWIPIVFFADDESTKKYKELSDELKMNELFIANLLSIGCPLNLLEIIDFDNFTYKLPDKFTFDNLPLWLFYISILFDRYLHFLGIDFLGQRPFDKLENELLQATSNYIEFEKSTEVRNICPIVYSLNCLLSFLKDRNPQWINEYKSLSSNAKDKQFHELFYATMLGINGQHDDASKIIDAYGEEELPDIFNILRIILYVKTNNEAFLIKAFQSMADYNKIIREPYVVNFTSSMSEKVEILKDYTSRLRFENPITESIFKEIDKYLRNENVDLELIKSHEDQLNYHLIPYVAEIYNKYESNQKAIKLLKPTIDTKKVNINLDVYLKLLKENPENRVEEYRLLKEIRNNGFTSYFHYLQREAHLSIRCSDFTNANEAMRILYEKRPDNDNILTNYLYTLAKINDNETIRSLEPVILSKEIDPQYIPNIFNFLLKADLKEGALEFLYKAVKLHNSQSLKELYTEVCLMSALSPIINKTYETVYDGSYVGYCIDGENMHADIVKDSTLENLIGQSVGKDVVIEINGKEKNIQIISVQNKYYKLGKEITELIFKNQISKKYKTFSIDDLTKGDGDLLENLARLSGVTPEFQKEKMQLENDYASQKATLFQQFKRQSILDVYDKLLGKFKIYNHPYQKYSHLWQDDSVNIFSDIRYVLDVTSLVIIHEICMKFAFRFPFKFIVSGGLKDHIDSTLFRERVGVPSIISQEAADKMILPQDNIDKNTTYIIEKMNLLLAWIEDNCEVQIAEDIMKADLQDPENELFVSEAESLLLALKDYHVLISEDWGLKSVFNLSFRNANAETLFYLVNTELAQKASLYLADLNFINTNINADYIYEQYVKNTLHEKNTYINCLLSIEQNKILFREVLIAGYKILTEQIDISTASISVTNMFVCLFKSMNIEMARKISAFAKLIYYDERFIKRLSDAFFIVFPPSGMQN
jgi:hypothetical protein